MNSVEEALGEAIDILKVAEGEWVSVTTTYAPEWTHPLKDAEDKLYEALGLALPYR